MESDLISARTCIGDCLSLLETEGSEELVVVRLDSLIFAIESLTSENTTQFSWAGSTLELLERAVALLVNFCEINPRSPQRFLKAGRPTIQIQFSNLEYLLSLRFRVKDIAEFYGVSRYTISRRLRENGTSVTTDIEKAKYNVHMFLRVNSALDLAN